MEWEASGWPRVQLKSTFTEPPLVVMFKLASPPKDQNFMNSITVAPRNWELDADMLDLEEKITVQTQDHLVFRNCLVIFI